MDQITNPVRWEVGDRIYETTPVLPGLFVFVYAAVIGWLHLKRWLELGSLQLSQRLQR